MSIEDSWRCKATDHQSFRVRFGKELVLLIFHLSRLLFGLIVADRLIAVGASTPRGIQQVYRSQW